MGQTITPPDGSTYVPVAGCSGCPHRGTCHGARQRIQDPQAAAGRHYDCQFFRGIERSLRKVDARRLPWWRRIGGS